MWRLFLGFFVLFGFYVVGLLWVVVDFLFWQLLIELKDLFVVVGAVDELVEVRGEDLPFSCHLNYYLYFISQSEIFL